MDRIANRRKQAKERRDQGKGRTSQIYNSFEPQEVQTRREVFGVMKHDTNCEGLTASDIKQSYGDVGIMVTDAHVSKMMGGQKEITFPIFLNNLTGNQTSDTFSVINGSFEQFDIDGSGTITIDQLEEILCSEQYDDPIDQATFHDLVNEVGKKGNNEINYEHLTNVIKIGTCEGLEDTKKEF